jgi:glycosyltransferase involved in cell wall biosynthesis
MEPTVSVILTVHNGVGLVKKKIENILSLDYPDHRFELIVADDGSDDGTGRVVADLIRDLRLEEAGREPKRDVKLVRLDRHRGKAAALNAAAAVARGEILVLCDLRQKIEEDAVRKLVRNFAPTSTRRLDIKLAYASSMMDTWDIVLPAGKKVVRLPDAVSVRSPFGTFSMSVDTSKPRHVRVTSRLVIEKTRIVPKEYAEFRRFAQRVDQALSRRLVVK